MRVCQHPLQLRAEIADCEFIDCRFAGCNFFDTVITGCRMTGSTFDRCAFSGTEIAGGDWSAVQILGADRTTAADFRNLRMSNANLSGAGCHASVFTNIESSNANLANADFTRADLRGSTLTAVDPRSVELRAAISTADQAVDLALCLQMCIG